MTTMTNATNNKTNFFCGVIAGYNNNNNGISPRGAASMVAEHIACEVYPAVAVYNSDWGCPVGGEVGGVAFPTSNSVDLAEALRAQFDQSTVTVNVGETKTVGFRAAVDGDIKKIGEKWQTIALEIFNKTNTYVSGVVYEYEQGLMLQAEANPMFVKDFEVWGKLAEELCKELGCFDFTMVETGITYLQKTE